MTNIKFPLIFFRRSVKYLVIIVFVVFINSALYILLKPLSHFELRSHSFQNTRTWTPKFKNDITQLTTMSTAKPEVETCQIAKIDSNLKTSNETGLEKERCFKIYTFQILFESRVTPYPMLVPLKDNITQAISSYNLKSCCFRGEIPRKTKICSWINLKRETKVPGDLEVIVIECRFDPVGSDSMIFKNMVDVHLFTPLKHGAQKRVKMYRKGKGKKIDEQLEKMNVIILGMGGVSTVDFKRKLNQSLEYLEIKLNAVKMEGFSRIGDDMLSSLGPLLTNNSFDGSLGSQFIWQNYANSGYYTLFAEDRIQNTASPESLAQQLQLNVTSEGIDYYFPQIAASSLADKHDHRDHHGKENLNCYGPRPTFQVMLRFMQKMISRMTSWRHGNFFQFAWLSSPSFLEDDIHLKSFLQWCHQNGHFNSTLLIFLSDQSSGEIENSPPFMQILMPFAYQKKYPTAYSNLLNNRKRLITVRDVYKTLRHVLQPPETLEYLMSPQSSSFKELEGTSLFLPISKNRTCKSANIPVKHCPCNRYMETLSLNHSSVEPAAKFSVNSINSLLAIKGNGFCAYLYLSQILEAKLFYFLDGEDENEYFLITFQTNPGNGTFQALVTQSWGNGTVELNLSGNILRANSHGNQSSCLHSPENNNILMYCYCLHRLNDNNNSTN